jgi:hypothetical protein
VARTRAYLDTRNLAYLESKDIPYPGPDSFVYRLNLPELSRLLPTTEAPQMILEPGNDLEGFQRAIEARALPWNENADTGMIIGLSKPSHGSQPPFHRAYWSSTVSDAKIAHGEWHAAMGPKSHGWLLFALRSSVGGTLEIRDQATGKLISELRSTRENEWTLVSAHAPSQPFVLRSRLSKADQSLSFTEPVLMPTLSFVAWQISANGRYVQAAGLALISLAATALALIEFISAAGRRPRRGTGSA